MKHFNIKSSQVPYTAFEQMSKNNEVKGSGIKQLTRNNHSSPMFASWSFPETLNDLFKDSRAAYDPVEKIAHRRRCL